MSLRTKERALDLLLLCMGVDDGARAYFTGILRSYFEVKGEAK